MTLNKKANKMIREFEKEIDNVILWTSLPKKRDLSNFTKEGIKKKVDTMFPIDIKFG